MTANISGVVSQVLITNSGSGYTSAPTVTFNTTGTGGTGPTVLAVLTGTGGINLAGGNLTFAGRQVPFNVQLLANGCFVSHPTTNAKPAVIYGCGVAPAPPVRGMQALGQEIAHPVALVVLLAALAILLFALLALAERLLVPWARRPHDRSRA